MSKVKSPLKTHGGKSYLAERIVDLMPDHTCYVEPYAGGLSVLLAKDPEGVSEIVNDIDGDLTNFWRVIRDEKAFASFQRSVEAIPFSEQEWHDARTGMCHPYHAMGEPSVPRALDFFVYCRQSLAGRGVSFAPASTTRTRRGMNEQASAWLSSVEWLPMVHARLKRVMVLNRPALSVIRQHDGPGTLFYLDPPYLAETRTAPQVYAHEMDERDHDELLDLIRGVEGKVMISGYDSKLYARKLKGWRRVTFDQPAHSAGGAEKGRRTEVVWMNYRR